MSKKFTSLDELPIMLNTDQVGAALGISRATAYQLVKSEGFPLVCIGSRYVVPKAAFLRWVDENTSVKGVS